ncbi:hypothetical protein K435DRAFT_853038 [Dendrothele bispora CBS 962.96]|uniref:Uncharacterized protein n=1 Tax=Dendrothele bispora (strain CBS 962.96) TaxID=1314807 RepID=A0A4V4HHD0_DENBC|nr:hypothetical protein K435DRAFT_853038 [Dendrothele bispora CBS 962.96]
MPLPHRFDEWDSVFKSRPSRVAEEEELLAEGFSEDEIPAVIERRNQYRHVYRKAMCSRQYYQRHRTNILTKAKLKYKSRDSEPVQTQASRREAQRRAQQNYRLQNRELLAKKERERRLRKKRMESTEIIPADQ